MSNLSPQALHELIERLRHGDDSAARTMLQAYSIRLHRLAFVKLAPIGYRRGVAAEDVVSSVCKTLIRRLRVDGSSLRFEDEERLFGWLATVTIRKCYVTIRQYRSPEGAWRHDDSDDSIVEAASGVYDAIDEVVIRDLIDRLLDGFDPAQRRIAELLILGETTCSVAEELECSEYSVKMIRKELKRRMSVFQEIEERIE